MLTTTNGLKKPQDTDNADLLVFIGDNMDTIETLLSGKASSAHTHTKDDLPYLDEIKLKTLTGSTTSAAYFAFAQTEINPLNYSAWFKIIITSPTAGIGQTLYVWVQGYQENAPIIHVFSQQKSTTAATTGLYYIRALSPKTAGNGYRAMVELYAYNTTQRDITIQMIEGKNIELMPSLTASIYNSTYHTTTTRSVNIDGIATSATMYATTFSGALSGNASSASYANSLYNSSFTAGEALVANDIIFLGSDNKWWKATTASRNIPLGTLIARCASTYAAAATTGAYLQGYFSLPTTTGTKNVYKDIYIRGTISGNNLVTDGTITTELDPGYSYMKFGECINTTAYTNYDGNNRVYTVDANGAIIQIDGKKIEADTLDGKHASDFALSSHTHDFSALTNKPTTLSGYGITDAASSTHNHDSVYAPISHGNHVPTTQAVNNAVFLRNDNTWATVTPANIGAAATSHSHAWADITTGKPTTLSGYGITDAANSSHTHANIPQQDTRSTDIAPFAYTGASIHLKSNTTDGLADGGTYHGILHLTQWNDISGGYAHQMGFTDNQNIWHRHHNGTAWQSWKKVWDSANFDPNTKLGTTGGTISGATQINATFTANGQFNCSGNFEHGSTTAVNTPYIDFHSSGNNIDFDSRIIADGGTTTVGQGNLKFQAKAVYANTTGGFVLPVGANRYAT